MLLGCAVCLIVQIGVCVTMNFNKEQFSWCRTEFWIAPLLNMFFVIWREICECMVCNGCTLHPQPLRVSYFLPLPLDWYISFCSSDTSKNPDLRKKNLNSPILSLSIWQRWLIKIQHRTCSLFRNFFLFKLRYMADIADVEAYSDYDQLPIACFHHLYTSAYYFVEFSENRAYIGKVKIPSKNWLYFITLAWTMVFMALEHKYPHLPLPTKKATTSEH
jgi:hypothetical protein